MNILMWSIPPYSGLVEHGTLHLTATEYFMYFSFQSRSFYGTSCSGAHVLLSIAISVDQFVCPLVEPLIILYKLVFLGVLTNHFVLSCLSDWRLVTQTHNNPSGSRIVGGGNIS